MALIVQSASTPATTSISPTSGSSSPQPRLISASIHSTLKYIPISTDNDDGAQGSVLASKPSCCRKLIHRFEKEARKRDSASGKRRSAKLTRRSSTSVFERLSDHKPQKLAHYDKNLTFCPKLNPVSIRLAQERSEKLEEIQSKAASVAADRMSKIYADYTFKPTISEKSSQIAQNIGTGFLTRQQQHLQRRQKFIEESLVSLQQQFQQIARPSKLLPANKQPQIPITDTTKQSPTSAHQLSSSLPSSPQTQTTITQRDNNVQSKEPIATNKVKKHNRSSTVPTTILASRKVCEDTEGKLKGSLIKRTKSLEKRRSPPQTRLLPQQQTLCVEVLTQRDFKKLNESERHKRVKVMAEKISRAKKVFSVKGGYQTIRNALRDRGWVESEYYLRKQQKKLGTKPERPTVLTAATIDHDDANDDSDDSEESESEDERENEDEYVLLSRALKHVEPSFIWSLKGNGVTFAYLKKEQMFNHFSKAAFTTKCGLYSSLNYLSSFAAEDHHTFFPRCYELTSEEERAAFIDDYRVTTAMNIIKIVSCEINCDFANLYQPSDKWSLPRVNVTCMAPINKDPPVPPTQSSHLQTSPSQISLSAPTTPIKHSHNNPPSLSRSRPQTSSSMRNIQIVPEECVQLAIKACEAFVQSKENNDIDQSQIDLHPKLTTAEWNTLIAYYESFVCKEGVLFCSSDTAMKAEELLEQLARYHPQLSMDGIRNMWIVKPACLSRGRGIECKDRLEDILNFVKPSLVGQWVIQKYIERPLLIYNTKFDIRQWFLVTDWNPLTMWMYRNSYLRFSSQVYSAQNLDRSIHLCNNSVQRHISISDSRSSELPDNNMWDSDTFQAYLRDQGEGDKWEMVIYPGMVDAIKHVLMVSQDIVEDRKNTFELYGADFMITTDYTPWLIEINCSPTMERNTTVTKRLCKEVMEDTIKVVIDRRSNKNADTGNFELAFKQPKLEVRQYVGVNLCVEGMSMEGKKSSRSRHQTNVAAIDLGRNFNFDSFKRTT